MLSAYSMMLEKEDLRRADERQKLLNWKSRSGEVFEAEVVLKEEKRRLNESSSLKAYIEKREREFAMREKEKEFEMQKKKEEFLRVVQEQRDMKERKKKEKKDEEREYLLLMQ
jgi:hypothetical protein